MAHIDTFKGWAETIRSDIDGYKALRGLSLGVASDS